MHGPTCIFRANLTPLSLQAVKAIKGILYAFVVIDFVSCLAAIRSGPPGAFQRPSRSPSQVGFVWRFCISARGASPLKTAVSGLGRAVMLQLPFEPRELSLGLAIFCAMPTTLSSGAVLCEQVIRALMQRRAPPHFIQSARVRGAQAGGNFALALLLTAGTNVLGIFTIPPMLKWLLSTAG
jgi:predicted Na+-dependent transporter